MVWMRVLIDTTYALRGRSGTAVYLERLIGALQADGIDVVEAADERRPPPAGGGAGSARNLAHDAWWTQIELPRRARDVRADVLHHPLPALAQRAPCPQVVTIHDLAFERLPDCFSPAFRRWAQVTHRRAARGADAVVCVSQTTRRDALARWGVDRRSDRRRARTGRARSRASAAGTPSTSSTSATTSRARTSDCCSTPTGATAGSPLRMPSTSSSPGPRAAPRRAFAASPRPTSRRCSTAPPRSSIRRCTRASA